MDSEIDRLRCMLSLQHLVACLFYMLSYLSAEDPISVDSDVPFPGGQAGYQPTECQDSDITGEVTDIHNQTHRVQGTMVSTWVCAKNAGRDQGKGRAEMYLLAIYFSITTVSTIGYGKEHKLQPRVASEFLVGTLLSPGGCSCRRR